MSNLDNLLLENESLKTEINTIKQLILNLENENRKSWSTIIDEKVEIFYEKFKDDTDMLSDSTEKYIYKKCIKIIFAMILEMKNND